MQYTIDGATAKTNPQEGDYNELSVVSEEFLDSIFRSVFEDLQVRHDVTRVFLKLDENEPFTVDFEVSLDFIIPSDIPTVGFLIDRIREAFERDASSASYLFDLNEMSETNPFAAATSFNLVEHSAAPAAGVNSEQGEPQDGDSSASEDSTTKYVMIALIVVIGFLVLSALAFLWLRDHRSKSLSEEDKNGIGAVSRRNSSRDEYNADEDTIRYLNTIRKRYRDEEEDQDKVARSAFEDVTLLEGDTRESNLVGKDSTSQEEVVEKDEGHNLSSVYQDAAEVANIDARLLDTDLGSSRRTESVSLVGAKNKANEFDYLGLELTNASFEEEDLRSIH